MKQMTSTLNTERTYASNLGFAGKLVPHGNWCHKETGLAGKLVSCYPCKIFIITLVMKPITFNAKVRYITIL